MRLSETVEYIEKSKTYYSLMEGLEVMIKNSKDSDKKEMLLDVIKYGKELSNTLERFSGTNQYYQAQVFKFEGLFKIEQRRVKELEILVENLKKGV